VRYFFVQPIVPPATKDFCKNIVPFRQALMLKTPPDGVDR
jgi:hypothetical protein